MVQSDFLRATHIESFTVMSQIYMRFHSTENRNFGTQIEDSITLLLVNPRECSQSKSPEISFDYISCSCQLPRR